MISPEILRKYPFFASLSSDQLLAIAMISEEVSFEKSILVIEEGQDAESFYLLTEGTVDLVYLVRDEDNKQKKEFFVGEIVSGEPMGIAVLIEPYKHINTIRTSTACKAIKISGEKLRDLCEKDQILSITLNKRIAQRLLEQLNSTRTLLAAAG